MGRLFLSNLTAVFSSFSIYLQRQVAILFLLGFSAGLPLMLVFSALSFWLREAGVERASIGFFSWVTLAYGFKWIWAPIIDRTTVPLLGEIFGRRRGWLILCQSLLVVAIVMMALTNPQSNLAFMALAAVLVAFCSATQDIVIDAFRIESGTEEQQAAMAASYMVGYRLAMIVATAGTFFIAASFQTIDGYDYQSWQYAYLVMAALMFVGIGATLFANEPEPTPRKNTIDLQEQNIFMKIRTAFVEPVVDMIQRYKWYALVLIILVFTYRISDIVMGVMANVFYVDMGYTKQEIAAISKVYGVIMTLVGAFFAGGLINRFGILPVLLSGAILSAVTNLLFVALSKSDHSTLLLTGVISFDNLSAGIAMASMIAFLSSLTNKEFTATQYAWLSSAMLLLPKFLGGFSGVWLDSLGYTQFFTMTALLGLPAIAAILFLMKKNWHA